MVVFPYCLKDISITTASFPAELDDVTAQGVLWQASSSNFKLDVPSVARYLVRDASSITIDPVPGASMSAVNYHLNLLPLAALLYQKGLLAFHASAMSNGQRVLLLSGDSGSGKSSLLMTLLQRGWRMLADDLAVVGLNEHAQPVIYPTTAGIALWPESLKKLGIVSNTLSSCDANRLEFMPSGQFDCNPLPLQSIYRLNVHSKNDVELETIKGALCFHALGTYLYNSHVADAVCNRVDYLRCVAAITQFVPISILRRPWGTWSVDSLANIIEI